MNQTKMFQADMFGGPAVATTAPSLRPQAPAQQSTMFDAALTGAAADLVGKGQVPPAYRSILALAELDSNRQALAVEALGTGRVSTPGAFRAYCAQLGKSQAAEETGPELLVGVVAEPEILPDVADVAPVAALDGDLQATNVMLAPHDTTVLTTVRAALGAAGMAEHGAAGYGWFVIDDDNPARALLGWTARPIIERGGLPSDGRAVLRQYCEAAGLICFDDDYRRGVWVQLTRFP